MVCQTLVYKEVTALFDLRDRELSDQSYNVMAADARDVIQTVVPKLLHLESKATAGTRLSTGL